VESRGSPLNRSIRTLVELVDVSRETKLIISPNSVPCMGDDDDVVVHQQRMRTESTRETKYGGRHSQRTLNKCTVHSNIWPRGRRRHMRIMQTKKVGGTCRSVCDRSNTNARRLEGVRGCARLCACHSHLPPCCTWAASRTTPDVCRSLCNTRCCLVRLQMAHVIHVANANVDRNKRPRNAVGVGAARSSAVFCCGCIGTPEVVPNEGHSIPLLSAHLVWVSSCTPHAAARRHTPPSQQPPSTHEFSFVECTPTSWRLRCKAEPTRLSVRTRCSPHFYARLGDPRSHGQQCMVSHLTHSIPSVRDNFHYIVLCLLSPHRRWRGQLLSWWSWRPV
jgi:hypothetical protein